MKSRSTTNKTLLANGVRVVTESLPVRTVSVGMWVDVGSRDEERASSGAAHFVEHMLFKGTTSRGALQIARELDGLGGASNAFTSKENTCLYATVLDSQLPDLVSLFSDILLQSRFAQEEVDRERSVILQEIDMVEDTPEDLIQDHFADLMWDDHSLARPVLGDGKVVSQMTMERLRHFVDRHYKAESILVVAAGGVDHDLFVAQVEEHFSQLPSSPRENKNSLDRRLPPRYGSPKRTLHRKSYEQAHIALGVPGLEASAQERFSLALLNTILGGNMSSRLFQEVRENRGLAYSIMSFSESYQDAGMFGIYTGVHPRNIASTLECIGHIIDDLFQSGVQSDELIRAKEYTRANLYLASENTDARMMRLAKNELIFGRYISLEKIEQNITEVSCSDVNQLAQRIFSTPLSGVLLGPVEEQAVERWLQLS